MVITLIRANQNSNSPNDFVLNKLKDINNNTHASAEIQLGISGYQKETYLATAVTSAMPEIIHTSQYVHPVINPARGPMYSCVISANELKSVLESSISPIALINIKSANPTSMYVNNIDGPAKCIDCTAPNNNPVPIAPPMAINCICLLLNSLFSLFSKTVSP